ncbi:MAG TPA: hypothetical protein VL947_09885 [Cytophagales bacterium]|nr:hypothetical protein [Cytophagales bacterium]
MRKTFNIISTLAIVAFLASCSKTVMVSDGVNTKKIKIVGNVEVVKENEKTYSKFESVKGTKYNIDNSNYTVSVK